MIKAHAIQEGLDESIISLLKGPAIKPVAALANELAEPLAAVQVCGVYYRNLAEQPYGAAIMDLLYQDKQDRRYYPIMQACYLGPAAFVLVQFRGDHAALQQFMRRLKGQADAVDSDGRVVKIAGGLRGLWGEAYVMQPREADVYLSDEAYHRAFLPMIQNVVHTCDTWHEASTILQLILHPADREALRAVGVNIS